LPQAFDYHGSIGVPERRIVGSPDANTQEGDMNISRIVVAAPMLILTIMAGAGCGSGSSSGGKTVPSAQARSTTATAPTIASPGRPARAASGSPLDRTTWLARGDAICGRLNTQLEATKVIDGTTREFARALPQAAAYEHVALNELEHLVPPRSKAHDWQQFLTYTQYWANGSSSLATAAQSGHFALKSPLAVATEKAFEARARIAKRDGFKQCSVA
jgi:hypothetical protein